MIGLSLGLGGRMTGKRSKNYPTAFFNGMDTTGSTYTGGPTYAPDNLGILRSAGANRIGVEGARLATTLAEGALLGPELFAPNISTTLGTGWSFDGNNIVAVGVTGYSSANFVKTALAGESYKIGFTVSNLNINSPASPKVYIGTNGGAQDSVGSITSNGYYEFEHTIIGMPSFLIGIRSEGSVSLSMVVSGISCKKVIPKYLDTTITGTPIVASTPQHTRTGNADFTAFTPGETFKRYDSSNPLVMPGFLSEQARTNKVTCRKSNPIDTSGLTKSGDAAAVLSVVDDTAALTAAGLIGVCNSGKVYKLDNSLGATVCYLDVGGSNSNLTPHAVSAYVRGSGTCRVYLQTTSPPLSTLTPTYQRVINVVTPLSGGVMGFRVEAGTVLYFILPQLEEGAFSTSPICKASDGSDPLTPLTRAGTVLAYPTAGKIRSNNMAFRMIVTPRGADGAKARIFSMYKDATAEFMLCLNATDINFGKQVGSQLADVYLYSAYYNKKGVPVDLVFIHTASYGMALCARRYTNNEWGPWTTAPVNNAANAKTDCVLSSNYVLGMGGVGFAPMVGNINLFDTLFIPDGIADPLAWAKSQWGIA